MKQSECLRNTPQVLTPECDVSNDKIVFVNSGEDENKLMLILRIYFCHLFLDVSSIKISPLNLQQRGEEHQTPHEFVMIKVIS